MIERKIMVGHFGCYCWLVACPVSGNACLIDPGDESQKILDMVTNEKTDSGKSLTIKYILLTHSHCDHIGAVGEVCDQLSLVQPRPKVFLHKEDEFMYWKLKEQGELYDLKYNKPPPIDEYLHDRQIIQIGNLNLEVLHTPGHSPGSVCFLLCENVSAKATLTLYSGDTLFHKMIGVSDFWGGDRLAMLNSINKILFNLYDKTRLCPSHGKESTIGQEININKMEECNEYPIPE